MERDRGKYLLYYQALLLAFQDKLQQRQQQQQPQQHGSGGSGGSGSSGDSGGGSGGSVVGGGGEGRKRPRANRSSVAASSTGDAINSVVKAVLESPLHVVVVGAGFGRLVSICLDICASLRLPVEVW